MQTYYRKAGELPRIPFTLKDASGPVTVPNTATVRVRARAQAGGTLVFNGLAVMNADQSGHPGEGTYTGVTADLATPGVYYGEIEVTWADGTKDYWPNGGPGGDEYFRISVVKQLP